MMSPKQMTIGAVALAVLALAIFRIVQWAGESPYPPVTHLFWCPSGHVHDFQQVAAAGRTIYRRNGQSEGDSVLVCAAKGCEEPSYPAKRCPTCGTRYLLFILPNQTECPTCHPEVATAAAARGINLTPPELSR